MDIIRQKVLEVLHNLNWLLEAHESYAELVEINGNSVVINCAGKCRDCEDDCVGVAFKERLPDVELIYYNENSV